MVSAPSILSGPRPFKYFEAWEGSSSFSSTVHEAWQIQITGNPMFQFVKKLANTKQVLKRWNKEIFGPIHHTLASHRCEMEEAQKALHQTPHDPLTRANEAAARLKYRNTLHQEELFARQKSRQLWLAAGDSNTKFFYNSIKSRSVKNSICCLRQNDGTFCSSSEEIKDLTVQYFQELLNQNSSSAQTPPLAFGGISEAENSSLCSCVTEAEMRAALFQMKALSSPGSDGFPSRFYQYFWDMCKTDLLNAINYFFTQGKLLRQVNHSFIALIPKSLAADSLDQYSPISLCNTFYKLITKIMALRLQPLLPKLISKHQSAFIKGRSIHQNILLAHELIKYLNSGPHQACIKVDLKKAFDSISWSYLEQVVKRCNFSDHWISLCMECITTPKYSVLINRSPAGFFSSSCGIRQGDPLSPLLFVLVMESFSMRINMLVEAGNIGTLVPS
ncbi:hypothetical protein QJS10_CPA07g00440 [Acorus calamus]|uniref:Reverse transcriptase domain-containing protein n=1 Tax=Acorus calamus TaxID=4465 RepID=A0AAV9EH03_ACOCL|nr:hypothetical protein QJS10_CPA07g00440 [Acorus calamus]